MRVRRGDLHRVPRRGPVVAVANHPFGMVEGVILGSLLLRVRPDVKFLANSMLSNVPAWRIRFPGEHVWRRGEGKLAIVTAEYRLG